MSTFFDQVDRGRPAVVMGNSGEVVTYGELDRRSAQLARALAGLGLRRGDHYAVFMENHPAYHEVVWAGMRTGLQVTTVNSHLTAAEAAYIVNDCGAKVVVTSTALAEVAGAMIALTPTVEARIMVGGAAAGHTHYDAVLADHPHPRLEHQERGMVMLYSSGTTGRPKGVEFPLPPAGSEPGEWEIATVNRDRYGYSDRSVYLSPAPLYHAAPLRFTLAVQTLGGTVVVMEHFEPETALALVERHRVTHSQWVPTMFVRMLKLPPEVRDRYDLSSQQVVSHAAAPCPVDVKERMIEWWGPIIQEYYSGTENIGSTAITSPEWLEHKGSVGRATPPAIIHICSEDGREVNVGEVGTIYFESDNVTFSYHGQGGGASPMVHPDHPTWRTLGDVGRIDREGYLYLTDRRAFMIVSGGVNIYPQEIEDVLVAHPSVLDVAVFGVPNEEFGQEVKAVVQPVRWADQGPELEAALRAWCGERLADYKRPRTFDFDPELPRQDNGKLYKTALRDRYWEGRESRIV